MLLTQTKGFVRIFLNIIKYRMMVIGEIAECGAEGARTLSNSQAKGP
jgi:hypothetical protein